MNKENPHDVFGPEAVQVAELKEAATTCANICKENAVQGSKYWQRD
uniref:Uncharacterized protein n=1 Tax=Arundo donax TaxID=35708 RepID=A0A0A9APD5_ARUDO